MFCYEKNKLVLKQEKKSFPIQEIAQREKTPFYLYDLEELRKWCRFFVSQTGLEVFFAVKCNFNTDVLKAFQKESCGADVVSLGEALRVLSAGFPSEKIIFSGVGKTKEELELALSKKFFQVNVESFEELQRLLAICRKKNTKARIGIRINPNINFESHPHIKTGLSGHKFGLEESDLPALLSLIKSHASLLHLQGLSMHIGSQIFDTSALLQALLYLKKLFYQIKAPAFPLETLDIGGGLGVDYKKAGLEDDRQRLLNFTPGLKEALKGFEGRVLTEPGRFLSARFGLLCAQVEYVKKSSGKKIIILNSGMNHFLRTALYGTEHRILNLLKTEGSEIYDVVGPICETGDAFYKNCRLNPVKEGDFLAIADAGAYGAVMSNNYNLQQKLKEISL